MQQDIRNLQLLSSKLSKFRQFEAPSQISTYEHPRGCTIQQYKLISTIYRFCALLGWLELYRQEVTFLDSGRNRDNERLERCIRHIREVLLTTSPAAEKLLPLSRASVSLAGSWWNPMPWEHTLSTHPTLFALRRGGAK